MVSGAYKATELQYQYVMINEQVTNYHTGFVLVQILYSLHPNIWKQYNLLHVYMNDTSCMSLTTCPG